MKKINKKGISLIVLIITIAIIIILASAVILSIANNRPIESAKEATTSHNDAVLKESAAVLSAQWEVDRQIDSSVGTRSEYVMQGLSNQGFTEEERARVSVGDNGEITVNIDIASNYNKYLEEAKALGQSSSNDVGIGTDGNIVNLDLWSYEIQSNSIIIGSTMACSYNQGAYKGKIINGKIEGTIPAKIYIKELKKVYNVTEIYATIWGYLDSACGGQHYYDKSLSVAPEIPNTVTVMQGLFYNLTGLNTIKIPASVQSFGRTPYDTFSGCTATIYVEKGSTLTEEDFTKAGATGCKIIFEK